MLVTDILGTTVWAMKPDGSDARVVIHPGTPISLIVGPPGTAEAGRVFVIDQDSGELSALAPNGTRQPIIRLDGNPAGGAVLPAKGHPLLAVLKHDTSAVDLVDLAASTVVQTISLGSSPLTMVSTPDIAPHQLGYALSQGNGGEERGSVTTISLDSPPVKIDVGTNPCCVDIAPSRTGAAGSLYVPSADGALTVIHPDGSARTVTGVLGVPTAVAIAPDGAPNAGTVYVTDDLGLTTFRPDGQVLAHIPQSGAMLTLAMAPQGTPQAGTLYIGRRSGPLEVLGPTSSGLITLAGASGVRSIAVAPAHTPAPGTVYAASLTEGTVTVFSPSGDLLRTIPLGPNTFQLTIIPPD